MWVLVLQTLFRDRQHWPSRYDEILFPRKMEFKGGITDNTRSSFQGSTNAEVMVFIVDLQK